MWSNIIFERDKNRKQYLKSLKEGYDNYKEHSKQKTLEEVIKNEKD